MAETMILALEGRLENYTLGPRVQLAHVREIHQLGKKHGFQLAGLRRFERALDQTEIDRIRRLAHERSLHPGAMEASMG
jgi:hypothetical protein